MKNSGICQLAWANGSCFGDVFPGIYAAENSTHGEVDQDKLSFFFRGTFIQRLSSQRTIYYHIFSRIPSAGILQCIPLINKLPSKNIGGHFQDL